MQLSSVLTPTGRWWRNGKMDFEILKPEVIEKRLREIVQLTRDGKNDKNQQALQYELLMEIYAIAKHTININRILLRGDKQSENDPTLIIDTTSNRICYKGCWLDLPPTPFQFIQALSERPGEVIGKNELYDYIWGNGDIQSASVYEHQLADTRHSLTTALKKLSDKQKTITEKEIRSLVRTRHRVGYSLNLDESEVNIIRRKVA
jgi:DNA-binding winged helix-turn-helix (wHTH) protein